MLAASIRNSKESNMIRTILALTFAGAGLQAQNIAAVSTNPVVQWNRNLLAVLRTPGVQPASMHPTRSFAIMHAAIYDAVNAIDRTHQPYRISVAGMPVDASQAASAAAAAHEVL